ncbi:MAG: molybdopterin converting factor subunit 1 [Myxococcaceae bacterium]
MTITVLYFAAARERTGTSRETLTVDAGITARGLLEVLARRHPSLAPLCGHLRVAVNQEFCAPDDPVPEGAEVALIPPVSGGSGRCRVLETPLSLDEVMKAVSGEGMGGVVTFTGNVRDNTRGRRVLRLEYEAYAPMAVRKLDEIADEASRLFPGSRVAISHRVGVLSPGEAAVVIAAAAPHRDEAFKACRHAIERLKSEVPIWKKEFFEDGQVWVGLGP